MKKHFLGCKRDLFDKRDYRFSAVPFVELPPKVDLSTTSYIPKIFNQGSLGSCTANAISNCYLFVRNKEGKTSDNYIPSRIFVYYNERLSEGTVKEDSGAMIRTGMKVINKYGACIENKCPYMVRSFAKKPSTDAYKNGLDFQSITYSRLNNTLIEMKSCLSEGYPFVLGIDLYDNFETNEVAKTGIVSMPEGNCIGGHAVLAVGYDDSTKRFKIMNSWGEDWGDKGYFYLPYEYLTNNTLTSDLWTMRKVE